MKFVLQALCLTLLMTSAALAQTWAPGILIDGNFDDWDGQVPALVTDPSGDGGTGRDIQAVYLCNDQNNLYVRIQSFNADGFDGNELSGIDGDASFATGFNLFGGGIGSDTLVAGASVFGETTGNFNSGAATPGSVAWAEAAGQTDVEYAISLATTIPGDIASSFPGGLGSTISFLYGDGNGGATDVSTPASYELASGSAAVTPAPIIDEMVLYDSTANAQARTQDISGGGGFSAVTDNFAAGGPGGGADTALQVTHTNGAVAFAGSFISHRFASPRNITGHTEIDIDMFGDVGITDQNIWVGLLDTGGTYYANTLPASSTASWGTINMGATSAWVQQAAGDDGVLDLANIIEWRVGVQETSGAGGTFVVGYDNLTALGAVPVELSIFSAN